LPGELRKSQALHFALAVLAAGTVAVVGFSGVVLVSHDGGRSFSLQQQADRAGLAAAVAVGAQRLVAVGEDGAKLIGLGGAAGTRSTP